MFLLITMKHGLQGVIEFLDVISEEESLNCKLSSNLSQLVEMFAKFLGDVRTHRRIEESDLIEFLSAGLSHEKFVSCAFTASVCEKLEVVTPAVAVVISEHLKKLLQGDMRLRQHESRWFQARLREPLSRSEDLGAPLGFIEEEWCNPQASVFVGLLVADLVEHWTRRIAGKDSLMSREEALQIFDPIIRRALRELSSPENLDDLAMAAWRLELPKAGIVAEATMRLLREHPLRALDILDTWREDLMVIANLPITKPTGNGERKQLPRWLFEGEDSVDCSMVYANAVAMAVTRPEFLASLSTNADWEQRFASILRGLFYVPAEIDAILRNLLFALWKDPKVRDSGRLEQTFFKEVCVYLMRREAGAQF